MASYVVAASIFVIGTSYLVQFVVEPPGHGTAELEYLDDKVHGQQLLEILLGSPGLPSSWGVDGAQIDGVDRLGLMDFGSGSRVNATKFDALARGRSATSSTDNGAVDYAEAKVALGLEGYDFHLSARPVDLPDITTSYGVEDMSDFRVAYVGSISGATYSTKAKFEADALDNLPITFRNATRTTDTMGDVYQDDSNTLRQHLLPNLGASIQQEVLGAGSGTKFDAYRVNASTFSELVSINHSSTLSRAMALSSDGATLGYSKSRELRSIVGTANLTGTTAGNLATVHWWEWVDTDLGNGTTDCGDYGYVEVSGNGGATWSKLTDTSNLRSQDCSPLYLSLPQMSPRNIAITAANCPSCIGQASVLVGFHWTADNDNTRGYGWVVDDMQVVNASDGKVVGRQTFESAAYDLLVVGSDASHNAFTPAEVKNAIRDYVSLYGGRILVLGGQTNAQWLDRLFDASTGGTATGPATVELANPLLTLPNTLSHTTYAKGTHWDFSASAAAPLFETITGADNAHPYLSVSKPGTWGNDTVGSVILTSYQPGAWNVAGKDETRRFFANTIVYGRYHHLYLEVGPPVPTGQAVASASRSATMNKYLTGPANYTELLFTIHVWPGDSTSKTLQAATIQALAVRNLTATSGDGEATLTWTFAASNGTGSVSSYEVWRGSAPDAMSFYRTVSPAGDSWSMLDTGLTNTQSYWYNVTVITSTGRGASSSAVSATPLAFPAAPTNLAATATVGGISLTWTPPANAGIGQIYGYTVWMNDTSGGFERVADIGNTNSHIQPINSPGTYTFKVNAVNGRGAGANSSVSPGASPIVTSPVAGPTLTVTRIGAGPNNLSLSWIDPVDMLGQTHTGYNIWRSADGASYTALATLNSPSNTSFLDATLSPGVTRYYRVQLVTDVLVGLNSTAQSATTHAVAAAPGSFNVSNATLGSLVLSWTAPDTDGRTLMGYHIERSLDNVTFTPLVTLSGVSGPLNLSFADQTVAQNTTYWYKMRAFTDAGNGTSTAPESMRTPGVPWQVLGLAKTGNVAGISMSMGWNAPTSHGGSPVTGYEIWAGTSEGGESFIGTSLTTSYTHLTSQYLWYKVRANNTLGSGPWSPSVLMVSPASAPSLTLANTTARELSLSWTIPSDTGGGTIFGYTLERSPDGAAWSSLSSNTSGANRTWVDATVADNTSYSYRVAALTQAGAGATGSATKATRGAPWPVVATVSNTTAHALRINWDAANTGGGSYASFTIQRSTDDASWVTLVTSANTNRSWTDATVADNATYYYRVFETNDVGSAAASPSVTKTSAGVAWPPSGLAKTGSVPGVSISMSWTAPNDGGSAITSYEIWRDGVYRGTSGSTSYTDLTAGAGPRTYQVRAVNGVGTGNFGASVTMSS